MVAEQPLTLEERRARFDRYVEKYIKRGFQCLSRSETTVELYKPAGFPAWLFKEQRVFADIDETGRIFVRKYYA